MSPVTIPAVEWFFGLNCGVSLDRNESLWRLVIVEYCREYDLYCDTGPDPIELIEAAYEELYLAPARKEIREEEP